ncbi:MAG: hypothetical protein IT443_11810 [Phycisphaeraceae bacterium]|nr:hypothetical protein [Phycisphaeraceae bacterium]
MNELPITRRRIEDYVRGWSAHDPGQPLPFSILAIRHLLGMLDGMPDGQNNPTFPWEVKPRPAERSDSVPAGVDLAKLPKAPKLPAQPVLPQASVENGPPAQAQRTKTPPRQPTSTPFVPRKAPPPAVAPPPPESEEDAIAAMF